MKLFNTAKDQLENFDYSVVVDRKCDVKGRSTEENERYAKLMLENVIVNIAVYLKRVYNYEVLK